MSHYIEVLVNLIINVINSAGYLGIAGGMLIESACIPLPSEIVLPLGGIMVAKGTITLLGANIAVAIGSMAGSLAAYTVGYFGGRKFILKYGKYFFVSKEHFHKAENTFNRYGGAAVFFGRLLPIIRTFISLPAGIARMDISKFILFSLVGMLPWNFILIFAGFKLGQNFDAIIGPIYKKFEYIVVIAILIILGTLVIRKILKQRKRQPNA